VNFGEAMMAGLKGAFRVNRRATRSEYWYFFVFVLLLMALLGVEARFFASTLARGAPCIVNLETQFHLRQITQPLSNIPATIGLLAQLAASVLFLLGTSLTLLVLIVPLLTLQAGRLHDTGRSGLWVVNANLAWMTGAVILDLAARADKPALTLAGGVIAIGFFIVPMTMLYLLSLPGEPDRNKYDYDRPAPTRRSAPPPLSTESLPPSVATPAESLN
jgi:uncharacterized membrane protein YhaH (DUF805 family)